MYQVRFGRQNVGSNPLGPITVPTRDTGTPKVDGQIDLLKHRVEALGANEWTQGHTPTTADAGGKTTETIAVSPDGIVVNHGLGRVPRGWSVVDKDAAAHIFRDSTGSMDERTMKIKSDIACNVKLRVY